ncbi:hypothetical protein [Rhodococcus rhodochrous]|nr:hypothetical protein [Rhodococcus rhodochrous]
MEVLEIDFVGLATQYATWATVPGLVCMITFFLKGVLQNWRYEN